MAVSIFLARVVAEAIVRGDPGRQSCDCVSGGGGGGERNRELFISGPRRRKVDSISFFNCSACHSPFGVTLAGKEETLASSPQ